MYSLDIFSMAIFSSNVFSKVYMDFEEDIMKSQNSTSTINSTVNHNMFFNYQIRKHTKYFLHVISW